MDYAAGSALLGLSKVISRVALIDRIDDGLPVAALEKIAIAVTGAEAASLPYNQFVDAILPKATRSRRAKGQVLNKREGEVITRVAAIMSQATTVFGGAEAARQFLRREHMMLEGRRPIDLVIQSSIGAELVADILGRLQYGSAA